jgi:hypothetical protein
MNFTQQQTLLAIVIPLEVIPTLALCAWAIYYNFQAIANIKPNSPWRWGARWSWRTTPWSPIPRAEFTELGLWYRHRAFIANIVFTLWGLALIVVNAVLSS